MVRYLKGYFPEFLRVDGDDVRQRRAPVLVWWFSLSQIIAKTLPR